MKHYEAIILDLEGTIIDTETVWGRSATEVMARYGVVYEPEAIKHLAMGGTIEKGSQILIDHYGLDVDAVTLAQERREHFAQLLEAGVEFMPGFDEFYERVKDKYRLAIATSMERPLLARAEHHIHLSHYFGLHIYSIADIGFVPKPQPDIFLFAAKNIKANPAKCVVIEDAPHGVTAAKAAGMDCIALTTSTTAERLQAAGADLVVAGFDDIKL